jgi:uncharacterized protein (TIRG00374 family)
MQFMKLSKWIINSLKLLFTVLLLFLVFRSVDLARISQDLGAFNGTSLILLLAVLWAGQLFCSERWRLFAGSLQMKGSYRSFVQMYFTGMFFNIGLPSLIGGDIVKAYIVSRRNRRPLQVGLVSVLQDRIAGLISLLCYGTLAILAHPISWKEFPLWIAYLFSWTGMGFAVWIVLKGERFYSRFLKPDSSTFFQKTLRTIAEFHRNLGMCRLNPAAVFRIALYSFLNSALILWVFQRVTEASGYGVNIVQFSGLFPLVTLATMLPITLGGLGVREWFYVEALSLVGIPRGPGLVISLATSALLLLCNLAGLLFLPSIPIDLRPRAYDLSKETGQS